MPKKLVINVGAIITRLMIASFFITTFRLFDVTEEKASITPNRMFEYVSAISIAWRLSIATPSTKSMSSSSNLINLVVFIFCKSRELLLSDVAK